MPMGEHDDSHSQHSQHGKGDGDLTDLLTETRILLPGTEVFLAFLMTLPFTDRFDRLTSTERTVYLCTVSATLLAFVTLVAPSAYHRICRPIRDKPRFKAFANLFLVVALAPISISVILAAHLIASMVVGGVYPLLSAAFVAVVVIVLWWLIPLARAHDRFARPGG
jgi:hypothetical protein